MQTRQIGNKPLNALMVFADVIESSKFSSVLGYTGYAKELLHLQESFEVLGRRYFPPPEDRLLSYCDVKARGDEGTVFVAPAPKGLELTFRALEFLYHLKGRLRFGRVDIRQDPESPSQLGVGAGIHSGLVAFANARRDGHLVMDGIEGYAINYAKRVEGCSRQGVYSRIVLSEEAAKSLEIAPVVLRPMRAEMKGINEAESVYEVQAVLSNRLKLESDDAGDEQLMANVCAIAKEPVLLPVRDTWAKALIISVLESLIARSAVPARKREYHDLQLKLAWHNPIEDDPILLFLRAADYRDRKEATQQLRYLRLLIEQHPRFAFARRAMIDACWSVAMGDAERPEKVLARDMAREMLDRFPTILTDDEKARYRQITTARRRPR